MGRRVIKRLASISLMIVALLPRVARAQSTAQMQVTPPYSVYFSDYVNQANRLILTVSLAGNQPRDVRFVASLIGTNGVEIRTNPSYIPQTPVHLLPGKIYTFTGPQLRDCINLDHVEFKGVSKDQMTRTGQLPEGMYQFCARVVDYQTGEPLSQGFPAGCSNSFMVQQVGPPTILQPMAGSHITNRSLANLTFAWLPSAGTPPTAQYRLRIAEIASPLQTPTTALRGAAVPLFDRLLGPSTLYLYQASDPKLLPGSHYAFSVTVFDPAGMTVFPNGGESEVRDFYCDNGETPTGKDSTGTGPTPGHTTTGERPTKPDTITMTTTREGPDTLHTPTTTTTGPACGMTVIVKPDPGMDGGLDPNSKLANHKIHRDDFIPLRAIGADYDKIEWYCTPSSDCQETKSSMSLPLTGRVRFTWEIIKGEGNFVKLGCLPDGATKDEGDNVIFQTPYVPLPAKGEEKKETQIKITTTDDNATQPIDAAVDRIVTIVTKRKSGSSDSDFYYVDVKADGPKLPGPPPKEPKPGSCKTDYKWEANGGFEKPKIKLPTVPDNDKLVTGEWIVLEAEQQRDLDVLTLKCISTCTPDVFTKPFEDDVEWNWSVSGGGKIIGNPGRFVIYEAPKEFDAKKEKIEVTVKVIASNPNGVQIKDKDSPPGEIKLTIYRPGVKLEYPPLAWLPKEDNDVDLNSHLVYKDGGKWNPALAHMCRIHTFELLDVSHEPGVCLNAPPKADAKLNADLSIADSGEQEVHDKDSVKGAPSYWREARTKKPVKEYLLRVHSHDFGAFGSLVSFANINKHDPKAQKSEVPYYESVAWLKDDKDIAHPQGRAKKELYKDNRVQIPRDVDENHIADGGWNVTGGGHVNDPADNAADDETTPAGDPKSKGDGFTAYEEYRGFKIRDNSHIRTDPDKKDLFICNADGLPIGLFTTVSNLDVHTITASEYNGDDSRIVNFNANTPVGKTISQCGLYLVDQDPGPNLLGLAEDGPAPPNWIPRVSVGRTKIATFCTARNPNLANATKVAQVVAHELSHGCNVYHHGEAVGNNFSNAQGPRSGDVNCIMRYDNWDPSSIETIGSTYCNSAAGTGSNANNQGYGNAARKRGNCVEQPWISGRSDKYTKR